MEDYKLADFEDTGMEDFPKMARLSPVSQSFFLAFGVGLLQSLIRTKYTEIGEASWNALIKEITRIREIASTNDDLNDSGLLLRLIEILKEPTISQSLSYLNHYLINNASDLFRPISNCMSCLLYNRFSRVQDPAIGQNELNYLSQTLNVYICIISASQNLCSKNKDLLPSIFLYRSNDEFCAIYTVLYHKIMLVSLEDEKFDFYPFVGNQESENMKNSKNDDQIFDLVDTMLQIISKRKNNSRQLDNLRRKLVKFPNKTGAITKFLERRSKDEDINFDYLPVVTGRRKCFKCKGDLLNTFPISLSCQTHEICIKCIVKSYEETQDSYCAFCDREYKDEELTFIESFLDFS